MLVTTASRKFAMSTSSSVVTCLRWVSQCICQPMDLGINDVGAPISPTAPDGSAYVPSSEFHQRVRNALALSPMSVV
jgi:hypothetical protein